MASFEQILGDIFSTKTLDETAKVLSVVGAGLDAIDAIAANPVTESASAIVSGVRAALSAIGAGLSGTIDPDTVRAELAKLVPALLANDKAADAALAAKFAKP